jgi:rod shape-determining protein MreB and related proteins
VLEGIQEKFRMIGKLLAKLMSATVYVQLSEHRIRARHIESGAVFDQQPFIAVKRAGAGKRVIHAVGDAAYGLRNDPEYEVSNPFSHPRMLVADFGYAEKVLTYALRKVLGARLLTPSAVVVIHPLEKLDGGLTDIECRVFRELALGAGAREVHIHVGQALSSTRFDLDRITKP